MLPTTAIRNALPTGFRLPVSFYRGGTSKGLLWSTCTLAPFSPSVRDALICRAMGSPDPDKRQIDGLGGGISSLSKTAIVGPPSATLASELAQKGISFKDGIDFADNEQLAKDRDKGWDLVYRFGQVPVESGTEVDWTSTCGNLVSAVALFGLHQGHVKQQRIEEVFEEKYGRKPRVGDAFAFPVRLIVTSSGQIIRANVPVTLYSSSPEGASVWYPDLTGSTTISGVPGTSPGILIETPLNFTCLLPTENQLDTLHLNNIAFPLTIINAGLPTIFISSSSIPHSILDASLLPTLTPSDLDANIPLMTLLEDLRQSSAQLNPFLRKTISPSAPKICIVHPKPLQGYTTTGGEKVEQAEMDLLIRAVSVGNFHRTVPATCLSALAVGRALPKSTIEKAVQEGLRGKEGGKGGEKANGEEKDGILSIRIGQPAGVSEASVKLRPAKAQERLKGLEKVPESIVYYRTARRIIQGWIDLPHSLISST